MRSDYQASRHRSYRRTIPAIASTVAVALAGLGLASERVSIRAQARDVQGCDFNADGFGDVIVGMPGVDSTRPDTGAVIVMYGSPTMLDAAVTDYLTSDDMGLRRAAGVSTGDASSCGDFDGDGVDDLLVGEPQRNKHGLVDVGGFFLVPGAPGVGVDPRSARFFDRETEGVDGDMNQLDRFGGSFGVGDFDGDGFDDVVVGMGVAWNPRWVHVFYGSDDGFDLERDHQITGPAGSLFGVDAAAGDFDGDGYDDVIVGAPADEQVMIFSGSADGLIDQASLVLDRDVAGVGGTLSYWDQFGASVASGDFDGDRYDDVAVGVPSDRFAGVRNAGSIQVFYGSATGITAERDRTFQRNVPGVAGFPDFNDFFGSALAAGDFDGDGDDDLAVGVYNDDTPCSTGTCESVGTVQVLYGGPIGLSVRHDDIWHQDDNAIKDRNESGDRFGRTVNATDFNGDGFADLVIGVPGEDIGSVDDVGRVAVIAGMVGGLTNEFDQSFWAHALGFPHQEGARFGHVGSSCCLPQLP